MTARANIAGGTAVAVLMGLTVPLFLEFYDRRAAAWNIVLVLLLVGVAVAAYLLAFHGASSI